MISVRRRLLAGLLALVLVVDGLAGFLSYHRALISTGTLLDYQLRQMALSLRDQGAAIPEVQIPSDDSDFDFIIQIRDLNGTSIYTSPNELPLTHDASLGYTDLMLNGERWRAFALQTAQRMILVAQPSGVREALAGGVALRTSAPLLVLTPLLALAIWWTVIRTLAPIQRIAWEVQRRDADSLLPLIASDLPREIEPLIAEFNRLLERLGIAFKSQRTLISDAAHELRSPLTALRLHLQLLVRATEAPEREQALERLTEALDRASTLLQQLLTLARNDSGISTISLVPLLLNEVVQEGVTDCASLAVSKETDLALELNASPRITGDAESLRIMVRNLVDNAVRYTPRGGRVLVQLNDADEFSLLDIDDSGPGINPSEYDRVFDRFYRGNGVDETGSGLGLAIVKAIVARHGGIITLGNSGLGGLHISVAIRRLPSSGLSNT